MPVYRNLSNLSRRELENLLLMVQGAYLRTLETVRTHAEASWKVRRDVERFAQETADRRPFVRAFVRFTETRMERAQGVAYAAWWDRWQEVAP
ncbi:MAG TPA: hypothetical protein VGV89_08070 [Thermoplasmata archaeon]|nr:hypothetical protein [Thermoplasmata archaeon]